VEIVVTNRQNMIKLSYVINNPCALISTIGTYDSRPKFKHNSNIKAILELCFDDVEEDCNNELAMKYKDAIAVADFVNSLKDIDILYVHCEAGISRSAGVAAAISKALTGDDAYFFERPFCPNMNCYKLTLKAFGLDITPTELYELDNKINDNIKKELEEWYNSDNIKFDIDRLYRIYSWIYGDYDNYNSEKFK
jgi:hypothetical protein